MRVSKDLAKHWTDIKLFYRVASNRSWEGLELFWGGHHNPYKKITPRKNYLHPKFFFLNIKLWKFDFTYEQIWPYSNIPLFSTNQSTLQYEILYKKWHLFIFFSLNPWLLWLFSVLFTKHSIIRKMKCEGHHPIKFYFMHG